MIVQREVEEVSVLVTNNVPAFITLVGRKDMHADLVCLNAVPKIMNLQVQTKLFEFALDLKDGHESVNDIVDNTLTDDQKFEIDQYTRHSDCLAPRKIAASDESPRTAANHFIKPITGNHI